MAVMRFRMGIPAAKRVRRFRSDAAIWALSRHSGARRLARARNPFVRIACRPMDSGLALRAPRNDGSSAFVHCRTARPA
ncbi:hypothetical protein EAS61_33860 [Bradyrhizobium zhanjiangense]|uniref:Uncharacterized protein n=1 Tax=Bradyrhizobium zhanjiangense TaxID=1325107 RepID=A0A4Q0Q9J3_9BRAD|nr:hypothetical protein EAS61_33860 [Bradyrhizobium zhanjiangense]RXG88907.1 hypothetical protein EAS62_32630 [Bradyrhizobium zhanjiangense]